MAGKTGPWMSNSGNLTGKAGGFPDKLIIIVRIRIY
jgi:hypothetical protein